jgi:hypothetical protein
MNKDQIMNLKDFKKRLQSCDQRPHSTVTWHVTAELPDRLVELALKDLPRTRMISEIVATEVAGLVGIATPAPYLVTVSQEQTSEGNLHNGVVIGNDSRLFFGSEYMALKTFDLGPPEKQFSALRRWANSQSFAELIIFDIIIGNVDRANRNIFVREDYLLPFDHDQAFLGIHWTPVSLHANARKRNNSLLDDNIYWSDQQSRNIMLDTAEAWTGLVVGRVTEIVNALPLEMHLQSDEGEAIVSFLETRARILPQLVEELFRARPLNA